MDDVTAQRLRERARAQGFEEVDMDEEKPVQRVVHEQPMDVSGVMHSLGALLLLVISAVITYMSVASAVDRAGSYVRTFGASRSTMSGPPPMVIFLLVFVLCVITMTLALFGVYRGLRGNSKWAVAIGLLAFLGGLVVVDIYGDVLRAVLRFAAAAVGLGSCF